MIPHRESALENSRMRKANAKARATHESAIASAAAAALIDANQATLSALVRTLVAAKREVASTDPTRPAWAQVGTSPAATVRVHLALLSAVGLNADAAAELWTRYDAFTYEDRTILTPLRASVNAFAFADEPSVDTAREALRVISAFVREALVVNGGKWSLRPTEAGGYFDTGRVFAGLMGAPKERAS